MVCTRVHMLPGNIIIPVDYHFMEGYEHDFQIQATMMSYDFKLFSNFTFLLNDPLYEDMIEPEGANYIPLAPRITTQGGFNFLHPGGFEAAIRFRHVGDRPANEDNSVIATGHFLTHIIVGYGFNGFRISCFVRSSAGDFLSTNKQGI